MDTEALRIALLALVWIYVGVFFCTALITLGGIISNFELIKVRTNYLTPLFITLILEIAGGAAVIATGTFEKIVNKLAEESASDSPVCPPIPDPIVCPSFPEPTVCPPISDPVCPEAPEKLPDPRDASKRVEITKPQCSTLGHTVRCKLLIKSDSASRLVIQNLSKSQLVDQEGNVFKLSRAKFGLSEWRSVNRQDTLRYELLADVRVQLELFFAGSTYASGRLSFDVDYLSPSENTTITHRVRNLRSSS